MKQKGARQFLKEGHLNFLLIFVRLGTHESGFCDENIFIYSFNKYLLNAFCGCVLSVTGQRVYHLKKDMLCIYIIRSLGRNVQELYKVLAMFGLICDATGYSAVSRKVKNFDPRVANTFSSRYYTAMSSNTNESKLYLL